MTETERMNAGLLYDCSKEEIMGTQTQYVQHMQEYNTLGLGHEKRMKELLKIMFAKVGEGTYIQPPFYANWGGHNVHLGKFVFANFGTTFVDDGNIYIGDYVMIAPNVTIATAGHPIYPPLREQMLQYNADVHIGRNVWIGAGSVICPGVTIGDNTVIGAGSIVVKDIPTNVVAVGNPCKVMRKIDERDKEVYFKGKKIDFDPDGKYDEVRK